jgi:hypothetical protein
MDDGLRVKINELFEYRGFPFLYEYGGLSQEEAVSLNELLVNLQSKIYYLDHYLESNWKIVDKAKEKFWFEIKKSLSILGIEKEKHDDYLNHIKIYEKHELQLRSHLLPTRFTIMHYYFYKSCDVKLIRRLLFEKIKPIKKLFNSADWRYFDLVTEINDDATDLEEDLTTINGNMLLISYYIFGRQKTLNMFNDFLDFCGKESTKRFNDTQNQYKKRIHKQTIEQIKVTKNLIKNSPILKEDRESILLNHLNLK